MNFTFNLIKRKNKNFKSKWLTPVLFVFIASVITCISVTVHAAYNASNLLGEYNGDGTINFTKSGADNTPNGYGFSAPASEALDPLNHRLFVADASNNRVLVFNLDANNNVSSVFARYVLGQNDTGGGNSATTTRNGLSSPQALAYDSINSRLFVADSANNRVLVFNVNSASISSGENADFVLGQLSFTTGTASTSQTGLSAPKGIAYDNANARLFVSGTGNNRVMVFNVAIATITNGEAATNVLGQSGFITATAATTATGLSSPQGLAYDSINTRLFVAENTNSRVSVFNVATSSIANGQAANFFLGQATSTAAITATTVSGMNKPQGLAFDSINARLFVSEGINNRVTVFDVSTSTLATGENADKVLGQTLFTTATASTTQSGLSNPAGLEYDPVKNTLYAADTANNRVIFYSVNVGTISNGENASNALGQIVVATNLPVYTKSAANNVPNALGLNTPQGLGLDTLNHRLFVGDRNNVRILVYQLDSSNSISSSTPSYVLGQPNFYSSTATTTQNGLKVPPWMMAYDSANNRLFAVDTNSSRVLVFNVNPATISNGENADFVLGQPNFTSGTATTTRSGLNTPIGVIYDSANQRLFVSENSNNRVLIFNVNPATISNGENADFVLGQTSFTTNISTSTQSGFFNPRMSEYDPVNSRLFVADRNGFRVLVFNVNPATISNGENADFVLGQSNFTNNSNSSSLTQGGMNDPLGLSYDKNNSILYIGDPTNQRILAYNVAVSTISNGENANAVIGQPNFTTRGAGNTQSAFSLLQGMVYDASNGHLFIADSMPNNRVLQFNIIKITTPSLPDAFIGTAYSQSITATSSQGTLSFSVHSGSLPTGLSLDPVTGIISGIPTASSATSSTFTIEVDDNFPSIGHFLDRATYSTNLIPATNPGGGGGGGSSGSGGIVPPSSTVVNFQATAGNSQVLLTWVNPFNPLFASLEIVRKSGSSTPSSLLDGLKIFQGTGQNFTDSNLTNGQIYTYALFSLNSSGSVLTPTLTAQAMPQANLSLPAPAASSTPPSASLAISPPAGLTMPQTSSVLVRLINDHGTYFLILDGVKHGITKPSVLTSFGFSLRDAVPSTSADALIPLGSILLPGDGSLVKLLKNPTIYLISNQQRYGFTSADVFRSLGFKFNSVLVITDPELLALPVAFNLSDGNAAHLPGFNISSNGTVYWMGTDGLRHPYESLTVFNSWNVKNDFSRVVPANSADLALPVGEVVIMRVAG